MAKEKKEPQTYSSFEDFVEKQYGKGIVFSAESLADRPRKILRGPLSLDIALSGGIPEGKIVFFSGKPKGGKTTICLEIIANAIKEDRKTFYLNIERRCDDNLLRTIRGLERKGLTFIQSHDESLTAEAYMHIAEQAVKQNPGCVIVIDSIAALCTMAEQTAEAGKNTDMAGVPKLLSNWLRKMKEIVDMNNCVVIFISQLQTNRDPNSRVKYEEKGGMAIQYACSIWLSLKWAQLWDAEEKNGARLGQNVHIEIKASALGAPYVPCVVPLRYGRGIDREMDVASHAENLGIIEKAGSWYTIPMLDNVKVQGINGVRQLLLEEPAKLDKLEDAVRKAIFGEGKADGRAAAQGGNGKTEAGEAPAKKGKK